MKYFLVIQNQLERLHHLEKDIFYRWLFLITGDNKLNYIYTLIHLIFHILNIKKPMKVNISYQYKLQICFTVYYTIAN